MSMPQEEPSMDEILASIRRIISEDDAPAEGAAPATAAAAPVPATAATPAPAPAPAPEVPVQHSKKDLPVKEQKPAPAPEEDVLELTERADAPVPAAAAPAPAPEPAPAPVAAAPAAPARVPDIDGSDIVGKEAAMASTTNFAQLAQATSPKGLPLGHMQQTLEELVKELLRPHLREWMDRNLPPLVERLVRAEIERIAREAEKAVD